MKKASAASVIASFIFLAGCAPGDINTAAPQLSPDKVAIVRVETPSKIGRVRLDKIDDIELKGDQEHVDIPAGRRTLHVSYVYGDGITAWTSEQDCVLTFTAEGAHIYEVDATVDFKNKRWSGVLMDVLTGATLDSCGE